MVPIRSPLPALATLVVALMALLGLPDAAAADGPRVAWSRDPSLVPWETMTLSGDAERSPARTLEDVEARRRQVTRVLDGAPDAATRARALAELGDLFRDEARLVLEEDASNPWRMPLPTSPAWLQLELALRWYEQALEASPDAVDQDGRLTLFRAVLLTRLGQGDSFEEVARVVRHYRGTPYVEMAKLAVGDHHYRQGDLDRARSAYKMVRGQRDPELSGYARYRLADIHAARGEPDEALELLLELVEEDIPGPLGAMIREASRSALANHLAARLPLLELLPWMHQACLGEDAACRRAVRRAASDTYAAEGADRADAWLRTVDASPTVESDLQTRLALARLMVAEVPVEELLFAAEETCRGSDPMCRAEMAHAVASFYEGAGDPAGAWLVSYTRLPRLDGQPEVQRLVARIAREPRPPTTELSDMEALCAPTDDGCRRRLRTHLRAVWGRLDRLHDAAWLTFVEDGLPVPGPPDAALRIRGSLRARAPAHELLGALLPGCGEDPDCRDTLFEVLVGYYAAIGAEREASWLIALKMLPELPLSAERRGILRRAALDGADARSTLGALVDTCPILTPGCFEQVRVAAEAFYRTAARHGEVATLSEVALLADGATDEAAFPVLVRIALEGLPAAEALSRLVQACSGRDPACGPDARRVLAAWYDSQGRDLDRRTVQQVDAPPDLGPWSSLGPSFLRVVRTAPDPREAAARVGHLCLRTAPDCPARLRAALADWYETHGRPEDAATVRALEPGAGPGFGP
jgi:tetratricopeptide (TPR) repeat protein